MARSFYLKIGAAALLTIAFVANITFLLSKNGPEAVTTPKSLPPLPPPPPPPPPPPLVVDPGQTPGQPQTQVQPVKGTMKFKTSGLPEVASRHDRECDSQVGWGVIDHIRRAEKSVCTGPVSTLKCYPHMWKHSQHPKGSFCDMSQVALVGSHIKAGLKNGWAGEDGHLTFNKGSLAVAACPNGVHFGGDIPLTGPLAEMFRQGTEAVAELPQCDEWIEEPVIALARNEWAHMLFVACEATNAFVAAQALLGEADAARARVLLLDTHPPGPLADFINALSRGGPVIRAKDFIGTDGKPARNVCFRRMVTSITGYASFLVEQATGGGGGSTCRHSPILKEWRNLVLSKLNLLDVPYPSVPTALFISRRPYHHEGFNKKSIGRVVDNEDEVSRAMSQEGGKLKFEFVDLATLTLEQQIQHVRSSNILIGMHGAGLVHALFLPDDAAVLEIFPRTYGDNMRDRNIARHMGHVYFSYELPSSETGRVHIDIEQFRRELNEIVHVARGSFAGDAYRCGLRC